MKTKRNDAIEVGPELPRVPLGAVTRESLLAEAALLGDAFCEVTAHPADLKADAEELLGGRADLADLVERDFAITAHVFDRIELLASELPASEAKKEHADAFAPLKTEDADAAAKEFGQLREAIAGLGKAAGLPPSLFSFGPNAGRLNVALMGMEKVLENVGEFRARMPDKKRLDQLVLKARAQIDESKKSRRDARLMRAGRTIDGRQQERLERLLLDAMQYVSAQGLGAYPKDPERERRYRLDHVYGRKASKVGDPGAGGNGEEK